MTTRASPRWKAALFDLDGTLVDTRPGVRSALAAAFAEITGATAPEGVDLSLPLEQMIRSAAPTVSPEAHTHLSAAFRRHYDAAGWSEAGLYPGAEECLRELQRAGVRLFVVTNKRTSAARRLLGSFGLASYFEAIIGQRDGEDPLPKDELAGLCLADAGIDPRDAVVVGDSSLDAAMATSWSMTFIAVTSGAGPLVRPATDEVRVEAATLAEVAGTVLSRVPGRKT